MITSAGVALEIDEMLSENHRMLEAARDLWRAFGPTLPTQAEPHPEMGTEVHIQTAFEYLRGGKLPVLSHPHAGKSVS